MERVSIWHNKVSLPNIQRVSVNVVDNQASDSFSNIDNGLFPVKSHLITRIVGKLFTIADLTVALAVCTPDTAASVWYVASQAAFWERINSGRALVLPYCAYSQIYGTISHHRRQFIIKRMHADFVFSLSVLTFSNIPEQHKSQIAIHIPWSFIYHSDLTLLNKHANSIWPSRATSVEQALYSLTDLSCRTLVYACYYLLPQVEDFVENHEYTVFLAHDSASASRLMHSPQLALTCRCKNLRCFGAFVPANQLTSTLPHGALSEGGLEELAVEGFTLGNILLQLPLLEALIYDVCPIVLCERSVKLQTEILPTDQERETTDLITNVFQPDLAAVRNTSTLWTRNVGMADVKTVSSVRDIVDLVTVESLSTNWPCEKTGPPVHDSLRFLTMGVNVRQSEQSEFLDQFGALCKLRMPKLRWLDSAEQYDHVLCSLLLPRLPLCPTPRCFIFNAMLEQRVACEMIIDNIEPLASGLEWLKMFELGHHDVDVDLFVRFLHALRRIGDVNINQICRELIQEKCFLAKQFRQRKCLKLTLCGSYVTYAVDDSDVAVANNLCGRTVMPMLDALCSTALGDGWNLHLTILIDFLLTSAFESRWLDDLSTSFNACNITCLTIDHRDFYSEGMRLPASCIASLIMRLPRLRRLRMRGIAQLTGHCEPANAIESGLCDDSLRILARAIVSRGKAVWQKAGTSPTNTEGCDMVKYCDLTIEVDGLLWQEISSLVLVLNEWSPDDVQAPVRVVCGDGNYV